MIEIGFGLGGEVAGHLVAYEYEAGGHEDGVCGVGVFHEGFGFSPVSHDDEDGGECEDLSDFDPDVE